MKVGRSGAKGLKIAHLVFSAFWVGGVASLVPMALSVDPGDAEGAKSVYLSLRAVAWNVVGWGGIGSFATGVALGLLTPWGLFKEPWTVAKLLLTVWGVGFGMFFVERHMLTGLSILEQGPSGALTVFADHHGSFQVGLVVQVSTLLVTLGVAVVKPNFSVRLRRSPGQASG